MKPIGSEKLQGDVKLKRILELTYYKNNEEKKKETSLIKETVSGTYGIVKEKDGYYVKKGLNESSLDYIGGLFMKNKNKFSSYGDALKKLELLTGIEQINEATKYVLKTKTPSQLESPMPAPTNDIPPSPESEYPTPNSEMPSTETDMESPEDNADDQSMEDEGNYLKEIQKLTGKLGQKLRDSKDEMECDDIKYVINMVLSAVDLDKLDENDKEEIYSTIEGTDDDEPSDTEPQPEIPSDETLPDDELGENIESLEELINTPFDDDEYEFPDDDPEFNEFGDLNKEYKYGSQSSKDINNDEDSLYDGNLEDLEDYKFTGEFDLNEDDPTEPKTKSTEDNIRELDINELTDLVNGSVKETLSKYFK